MIRLRKRTGNRANRNIGEVVRETLFKFAAGMIMYSKGKAFFSFTPFFKETAYCQGLFPLEEHIKMTFNLYSIVLAYRRYLKIQDRLDFC